MISLEETRSGVTGALAMVRGRLGWEQSLDTSTQGLRQSFGAVFVGTLVAVAIGLVTSRLLTSIDIGDHDLVEFKNSIGIGLYLISTPFRWLMTLAIFFAVAERLPHPPNLNRLIIGYNWAELFRLLIMLCVATVSLLAKSQALFAIGMVWVLALSIWIYYGVIRRGLNLAPPSAIALMGLVGLMSFLLQQSLLAVALIIQSGLYGVI